MSSTSSEIKLDTFLETCQTGDILLYNSNYWYSRLIEWGSGSKFSHISIVLRDPTFINEKLTGQTKNFGQFLSSKKEGSEKKIFANLIGRN